MMKVQTLSLKNLIQQAVLFLVIIFFLVNFIVLNIYDAYNLLLAPFTFDVGRALQDEIDKPIALPTANDEPYIDLYRAPNTRREYNIEALQIFLFENKYVQSGKYVFKITPDEIFDLGLQYEATITLDGFEMANDMSHKYLFCRLGNACFFIKAEYDASIPAGESLQGVFLPFQEPELRDIKDVIGDYDSIDGLITYVFDTTEDFFFERAWSSILVFLSCAIVTWLLIILLRQMISCENRYIYKQVRLLRGDVDKIDEQLENVTISGKSYVTKDWIITPRIFRTSVTRISSGKDY